MTTDLDTRQPNDGEKELSPRQQMHAALQAAAPELERLGVDGDRLSRILWTEAQHTPALLKCDPGSFVMAAMQTAQLGLEPGHGDVWMIPRKVGGRLIVTWQLGYKGLIKLAGDEGVIVHADAVYPGDEYRETSGTNPAIEHVHGTRHGSDDNRPIRWYAVATHPDGRTQARSLTLDQIKHRVGSAYTTSDAWKEHHDAMCLVTAIRSLKTFLSLSPRAAAADAMSADGGAAWEPTSPALADAAADAVQVIDTTPNGNDDDPDDPDDSPVEGDGEVEGDGDQLDEALLLNLEEWRQAARLESDDAWAAWISAHCEGAEAVDQLDEAQARGLLDATRARAKDGGEG